MNKQIIKKYIELALGVIDKHEEDIRLDTIRIVLSNRDIESNHTMFELVEREKNMNNKQVEILKTIKEELINNDIKEIKDLLNIIKDLNIVTENTHIEMHYSCITELISALINSNDNIFSIIKMHLEQFLGPKNSLNLNSRYELINDLLDETKETEDKFYRNYQKIKRRRENKDE